MNSGDSMRTKYKINYYYDCIDEENKRKFILKNSRLEEGEVGQIINDDPILSDGFYVKVKQNLPYTLKEDNNEINIYYSAYYREYIYNQAHSSITSSILNGNIDVFLKLIGCIYGDLYMQSKNIDDYIDVDKVDEEHLRHLAKLVGYTWEEGLSSDEQRESIKFYTILRRMRGTNFALTNLIRIFGQTSETLYKISDRTGVRVHSYEDGDSELYPGDIQIEIPETSAILRNAIEDVKMAGTRIIFVYRINVDPTKIIDGNNYGYRYLPRINTGIVINVLQNNYKGWDKQIEQDIEIQDGEAKKLIYKYTDDYNLHGSIQVLQNHSEPTMHGTLFNIKGLSNYRGDLTNDTIIDELLYLYR